MKSNQALMISGGTPLPGLQVQRRPISELKFKARNARKHTDEQIERIRMSIEAFGFVAPVVVGSQDEVLAGEARLKAAKLAGLTEAPVISLAHLSQARQKAYMLADNRLAELASWDDQILALELQDLSSLDLDFSLDTIGFDAADLERIAETILDDGAEEDAPPPVEAEAITKLGDVWLLGDHRLICGDSRDPDVVRRLMGDEQARMVFTDPPYNCPVKGHITKRNSTAREFPMAVGEMSDAAFTDFLEATLSPAGDFAVDGAIAFVCMDWRNIGAVMTAGAAAIGPLKNLVVWAKPNAGMGAFYRSQHELIFVFKKGKAAHVNTFGLGQTGRYRTNVWTYPGASGFHADRDDDLALHVTPKPVAMVADAILDVSHKGDVVLDVFGGSGSTLMAAERTGRRARLIELDPLYCDVICRRFIAAGGTAVRERDGITFDQAQDTGFGMLLLEGPNNGG